jgi:hypothetical protein
MPGLIHGLNSERVARVVCVAGRNVLVIVNCDVEGSSPSRRKAVAQLDRAHNGFGRSGANNSPATLMFETRRIGPKRSVYLGLPQGRTCRRQYLRVLALRYGSHTSPNPPFEFHSNTGGNTKTSGLV